MAWPSAEQIAYRGINTGNAEVMAYRGWKIFSTRLLNAIRVIVQISRSLRVE